MIKIFSAATSLGSFNEGTELAPDAILDSSLNAGLNKNDFDYEYVGKLELLKADVGTNQKLRFHDALVKYNKDLYMTIKDSISAKDTSVVLGGDHSVSIASMFATKLRHEDAVVVYIDAHPDCSGPDGTPTGNIHGMPLSTVMGDAIYADFDLPKYNYEDVFIIGTKDIDDFEQNYMSNNHIMHINMDEIIEKGIAQCLNRISKQVAGRPVHVSLDIDSIDTSEAPGTGIINKGGFSYREISYLCRHLSKQDIVAIDIVEVNPKKDIDNKTVHLASELCVNLLGGEWSPYSRYIATKH